MMNTIIGFTEEEKFIIAPLLKDVTSGRVETIISYLSGYLSDSSTESTSDVDFLVQDLIEGLYEKLCDFEDKSYLENILSEMDWSSCFDA